MSVSLSVEEEQTVLSLIAEERIQRERDGATRNSNVFQESQAVYRRNMLPIRLCYQ